MITENAHRCAGCQPGFDSRQELRMHRRKAHRPTPPPLLIRLAHALRAMHQEQVYAMECLLRLSRPPQADSLTWIRTRHGYCLTGWYLPARPLQPTATEAPAPWRTDA
jgi:hypothetical protein